MNIFVNRQGAGFRKFIMISNDTLRTFVADMQPDADSFNHFKELALKDDLVVTYGGVLSGTVDFASADLFGSSGSMIIWETENVTTPTHAPEYYSYGVLVCTRTTHLYKQELISGSINGAKYEKIALTRTSLETASWYKYTGTVANQS